MFPLYLQYLLIDFRQTFVTGASWDSDDLITFLGQKVKVQGHTIAAEAHSTRRYRRVQLFLVVFCRYSTYDNGFWSSNGVRADRLTITLKRHTTVFIEICLQMCTLYECIVSVNRQRKFSSAS